jgi:hypothetical protein
VGLWGLRGGMGTACDRGEDNIFFFMSCSAASSLAKFCAISSCLAAS